jgi:molybdate transport system ATP-binding protein
LSTDFLKKKIIELSSGETRKILLLKNLFKEAKIYILDNPFTGLDIVSIFVFANLFKKITTKFRKTIILLLNDNQLGIEFSQTIDLTNMALNKSIIDSHSIVQSAFFTTPETDFSIVFQIENTELKAREKILINDLNWVIKKGEKWLLKGANGSGKTTLMSLLNADNPIAYKHRIKLFDRARGTGESIWDIKSRIGFISSEIQFYFNSASTVKSIILSGFSDTMVLNRKINDAEEENYCSIINTLGLTNIEDAMFGRLSSGEKKMVMVARAFVKNPPVLILDEPFQGLDNFRFEFLYNFITQCADENRTVIQITHLEHEILPCIDHIALIENAAFYLLK